MNDEAVPETKVESLFEKIITSKKYQRFLLGVILLFVVVVVISVGKISEQKRPVPTPIPTPVPIITPKAPRVEDQIIIKLKPKVSEEIIIEILRKYNATIVRRIEAIHRIVIQVPKGQGDVILEQMKRDNLIEDAEPNYILRALYTPNDPSFNVQWGLDNTGQSIVGKKGTEDADIDAKEAWDITKGSQVLIAVLDSGIDTTHPDLSSKIVDKKDFSGGTDVKDLFGHGTHCAGIIAAATDNGIGISGGCPDCQLIIGKVLNDMGSGTDSDVIAGIIWAADNNAKVISMSFGETRDSTARQDAVNYAWNKGSVLVAAAGNRGTTDKFYPAANDNVISVAATNNTDGKAYFSTYGTWVDVAAPGQSIYSTLPTFPFNMQQLKPGLQVNYDYLDGTSMAAPMVAGVVGLIWSTSHGISNTSVVERLLSTTDKITGTGEYWINGRVNAALAVSDGTPVTPMPTNTLSPTPTVYLTPVPSVNIPTATPTPGFFCIGSCPTLVPIIPTYLPIPSYFFPIPTSTPVPTVVPTSTPVPTVVPTSTPVPTLACPVPATPIPNITISPTLGVTPTVAPTIAPEPPDDINEVIKQLLELIKKLLELIFQLIGPK